MHLLICTPDKQQKADCLFQKPLSQGSLQKLMNDYVHAVSSGGFQRWRDRPWPLRTPPTPENLTEPVKRGRHRLHSESEHKGEEITLNEEPAKACLKRDF